MVVPSDPIARLLGLSPHSPGGRQPTAVFEICAQGGQPRFLTPAQVVRIAGRLDGHYRQKALGP